MNWSDVQLFLAVVRIGTVRGAARALRLDPSTVSRRVAALEQATGSRLFERSAGRLALTTSGTITLRAAERIDAEFEELSRRIVGQDRRLRGVVRLTFPGALAGLVHDVMGSFSRRQPTIEVELATSDSLLAVDGHQADVTIRAAAQPPEHLVGRRVATLAGAVYAAERYFDERPLPLDSGHHTWVDWDRRLASKPALAWLDKRFPERRIVTRGLSTLDILYAIRAGVGVGALPCLLGDREPTFRRVYDAPRETWSNIWLLTHPELRAAARVRAVLTCLWEALRSHRAAIEGQSPRAVSSA